MDGSKEDQDKKAQTRQPAGFVDVGHADNDSKKEKQEAADFYALLLSFMGEKKFPAKIDNIIKKFSLVDSVSPDKLEATSSLSATCPCGCGEKIDITRRSVLTDAKPLSMEAAIEMAVLALANPSLRQNGVTLQGTDEEKKTLAAAAQLLGLKIKNLPADFDKDRELNAKAERALRTLQKATHNHSDTLQTRAQDDSGSAITRQEKTERQYQTARDAVLKEQRVSKQFIKQAAHVGHDKATKFVERLEKEGVIEKTGNKYGIAKNFNNTSGKTAAASGQDTQTPAQKTGRSGPDVINDILTGRKP